MVRRTFALVHGAWHDGTCWAPLARILEARGHAVVTPTLPCDDVAKGFDDYAAVVVDALAERDPAFVVGHSLGSETIGLVAESIPVRMIVYLCPRLGLVTGADDGPSPIFRDGVPWPPIDEHGRSVWPREVAMSWMYAGLGEALASELASRLRPQASPPRQPRPLSPDVRRAVLYTSGDQFFRPEREVWVARHVLGVEPLELPGGHFPMFEHPERLADVLETLAA